MRTINVVLRPVDTEHLRVITQYMRDNGLLLGNRTVSQTVRFALGIAADSMEQFDVIDRDRAPVHRG